MLISRCAWHPRYHGYPLVNRVVSWRGFSLQFTDGICPRCAQRFRGELAGFINKRRQAREETVERPTGSRSAA